MATFKDLIIFSIMMITIPVFSQQQVISSATVVKLDSLRTCAGKEKHFGELYLNTTIMGGTFMENLPEEGRILMKRMEECFATYFFRAIEANNNRSYMPDAWKNYFNGNYSPLQLKLMGANAHINGDIWQALTGYFSLAELRKLKPYYKNYGSPIQMIFDELFSLAIRTDKRLHDLHSITFGFDRLYGRMMLKKWRNRQLRLALFNYEHPQRFIALKNRIDKKRDGSIN